MRRTATLTLLLATTLLLAARALHGQPAIRVRALLIGNSAYAHWPALPGAAKDLTTIHTVLVERFKVPQTCIHEVRDASRAVIEAEVRRFIDEVQAGDTAVFYYSGHGAVVLDDSGTDPNGLNECIVGIDAPLYDQPDFAGHVVRNRYFEQAIAGLKAKVRANNADGHVLLIFDSCHSGSISRGATRRFRSAAGIREYFMKQAKPSTRARTLEHAAGADGWVLLAACRAEEEAQDDKSFTQYLAGVLQSSNVGPHSDYVDLMQQIGTTDLLLYQSPQAEGQLSIPLLGGGATSRPTCSYVRKSYAVDKDVYVELDQGTLVGFTPGSRIAIYKAGTHSPEEKENKLTEAIVESDDAGPFKVTAHITGSVAPAQLNGAVVFMVFQVLTDASVKVFISPEVSTTAASTVMADFRGPLKNSVDVVAAAAQAHLMVLPAAQGVRVVRLSGAGGVQATLYEGTPIPSAAQVGQDDPMVTAIKAEARRLALMTLVSGDDLAMTLTPGRYTMEKNVIKDFKPDGGGAATARARHLDGTALSFHDGDQAQLEITNHGTAALYPTVLYFNARGGIDVIFPPADQQANWAMLEPGKTLLLPMAFSVDRDQRSQKELVEAFKLIGTKEKINTDFLRTRGSHGDPPNALERLLGDAANGEGRRGAALVGVPAPRDYVMTAPVWVHVHP